MKKTHCSNQTIDILISLMLQLPDKLGRSVKSVIDQTHVDLYKYKKGGSSPLMSSFFDYCFSLPVDPSLMITLACKIEQSELSETEALDILVANHQHQLFFAIANDFIIKELVDLLPKTVES